MSFHLQPDISPVHAGSFCAAVDEQIARAELGEIAKAILDFESRHWPRQGAKESAIGTQFGMSATGYYQQLNAVIDTTAALAHDPILVNRLRGLRDRPRR